MKQLLRKELREHARECFFAALIGTFGLIALGRFVVDYGPPSRDSSSSGKLWALFCLATGAAMGFWQLREERTAGTENYLHHRATGPGGAFAAKLMAGFLCLAMIVIVELGLHALWLANFSEFAPLIRWERLDDHLAVATLIFSSYAIGLWTSSIPRAEGHRLMILLMAVVSLYTLSSSLSLRWSGEPTAPIARFVGVQFALTALCCALAYRLQTAGTEPERPLRSGLAMSLVLPGVLLLGLPLALLPSSLQRDLRKSVLEPLPHIVWDREQGDVFLATESMHGWAAADERGEAVPERALEGYTGWGYKPEHRYQTLYDPSRAPLLWATQHAPPMRRLFGGKAFHFDTSKTTLRALGRGPRAAWFDMGTGEVLAVVADGEEPSGLRRLTKPGGERFSDDTVIVFADEGDSNCLIDRGDATAWQLVDSQDGPALAAAPLPNGERLLDAERVHGNWRVSVGLLEPYGVSDSVVARGEHGYWSWSDDGWRAWEPTPGDVLESAWTEAVAFRLEVVNRDALQPQVRVVEASTGATLLNHDYAQNADGAPLAMVGTQALTLLRPPLLGWLALREEPTAFDRSLPRPLDRFVLDPALAGGNRAWLAALSLLVAALMALAAWRSLGDAPEDRARRVVWACAILLVGWPALLACQLIEPRRVKRVAHEERRSREQPLVLSREASSSMTI